MSLKHETHSALRVGFGLSLISDLYADSPGCRVRVLVPVMHMLPVIATTVWRQLITQHYRGSDSDCQ